ncbi:MAG: hypothetical protein LBL63_04020, partial [Clostridiales Family XIII bacterium]|nr:hypothetical protein [Clostridiales Family XIII bacterium]
MEKRISHMSPNRILAVMLSVVMLFGLVTATPDVFGEPGEGREATSYEVPASIVNSTGSVTGHNNYLEKVTVTKAGDRMTVNVTVKQRAIYFSGYAESYLTMLCANAKNEAGAYEYDITERYEDDTETPKTFSFVTEYTEGRDYTTERIALAVTRSDSASVSTTSQLSLDFANATELPDSSGEPGEGTDPTDPGDGKDYDPADYPNKAAFEEILAWIDAQDELHYQLYPWTNMINAVNALKSIYYDEDGRFVADDDITDAELTVISNFKSSLSDISSYFGYESATTPEDGYYLANLSLKEVPWSSLSAIMRFSDAFQRTALIRVEDGEIYVTIRVGETDTLKALFVGTSEAYRLAVGTRFPMLGDKNIPDGAWRTEELTVAWAAEGNLNPDNNRYWRDDVTFDVDPVLKHADVTFKLDNIAEDVYVRGLMTVNKNNNGLRGASYAPNMGLFIDEGNLVKLPDYTDYRAAIEGGMPTVADWGYDITLKLSENGLTPFNGAKEVVEYMLSPSISVTVAEGGIAVDLVKKADVDPRITSVSEKTEGFESSLLFLYGYNASSFREIPEGDDGDFTLRFPAADELSFYKTFAFGKTILIGWHTNEW